MTRKANENKPSPLYTNPKELVLKTALIKRLGKDSDGAYRAYNRIDRES